MKNPHLIFRYFLSYSSLILILFSCSYVEDKSNTKPNIIVILTDDQAYGDLSLTENSYLETPNIDNLAKTGLFANHFYVSPVCAPTRASLLTGRYHQRTGVSGVTRGREDMKLDEVTLANVLKSKGYRTGIFGKWHNGAHYPYHPLGRGFDEFVGFTSGHWSNYFDTTIEKNKKEFKTEGYLSNVLTDELMSFIENSVNNDEPFFSFLTFQTPHTPLQVPDKYFDKYKAKGLDDFNSTIYGMVENIDDNIGRIQDKLQELNIEENTLIVYVSDNGPLNYRFNNGLKGKKGSVDEGGVRVPFIMNWKGKIEEGKTINSTLAHIDLMPTLLELIGEKYDSPNKLDGISFSDKISGDDYSDSRIFFMEWQGKKRAVKNGFLMVNDELFNIDNDPQQKVNVAHENPELYLELRNSYNSWYQTIGSNDIEEKFIPIGYKEYPLSILPAHEANFLPEFEARKDRKHTGIAYHSLYGWAHDWVDYWTKTDAYLYWNIDVVKEANYEIAISYALSPEDVGTELVLKIGNHRKFFKVEDVFEHSEFKNHDRVKREQEAPETDWKKLKVGEFKLLKGKNKIELKAISIPGEKTIELKDIRIKLIE